jgi:hypothetical protein
VLSASGHRLKRLTLTTGVKDCERESACEVALRDLMRGNETSEELCFDCDDTKAADSPIADLVGILCDNPRSTLIEIGIDDRSRLTAPSLLAVARLIAVPRMRLNIPFDDASFAVRQRMSSRRYRYRYTHILLTPSHPLSVLTACAVWLCAPSVLREQIAVPLIRKRASPLLLRPPYDFTTGAFTTFDDLPFFAFGYRGEWYRYEVWMDVAVPVCACSGGAPALPAADSCRHWHSAGRRRVLSALLA